jgi:uncharacterized membrane protein
MCLIFKQIGVAGREEKTGMTANSSSSDQGISRITPAACRIACESLPAGRERRTVQLMSSIRPYRASALLAIFAVAACHSASDGLPGDPADHRPWNGIAVTETVHFVGTEPFWGGQVASSRLTYTTPDNAEGETVPVTRFAGRGGVSFSGKLSGGAATLAVTPSACSDGMSDTGYPFTVTLQIGEETRQGCGWTDRSPRTGSN